MEASFLTPTAFIHEARLVLGTTPLEEIAFPQSDELPDIGEIIRKGKAHVNAGSIIGFAHKLSPDAKRDVLESTLFAQLAANALANRLVDPQGWYQAYQLVLSNLGWSIGSFTLVRQTLSKARVEIADAAIEILTKTLGGLTLDVLESALDSIRSLKDDDGLIELFDKNAMVSTVANFQLGQASADDDGNIDMPVGFFFFKSDSQERKFLFFRWNRKRVTLFADAQLISLNVEQYHAHRATVRSRLKDTLAAFIRDVPLAAG